MTNRRIEEQATLAFEAALRHGNTSEELLSWAAKYESFGWHDAARGTRIAAARLKVNGQIGANQKESHHAYLLQSR